MDVGPVGHLTGHPVLVNTSLNGPNEPIVHTPTQALAFCQSRRDVSGIVLGGGWVETEG